MRLHTIGRFNRHSVFFMVMSLFVAITIPVLLLGYGIYSWGYAAIERETTDGFRTYLSNAQLSLESELTRIRTLQYSCLNDEDLFYTVNAETIMTPFQRAQALLTMQHRLEVLEESSDYIADVQTCLIRTGRMVSSQHGVEKLTDGWKSICYQPQDRAGITYLNDSLYLCASYPVISPNPEVLPLYTIIITLQTDEIQRRLLSFNTYQSGAAALYNREQGFVLARGAGDSLVQRIITDEALLNRLSTGQSVRLDHQDDRYLVVGNLSEELNMVFFSSVAEEEIFGGLWHYRRLCVVFFSVMLAVAIAFSLGSYWLIRKPMKRLVNSLQRVEKGDLSVRIKHGINDEYAYLYDTFNSMADALQKLIDLNYKQQLLTQQAQMRQLQTQINPHFLYNSFFTLYRMAKDEDYESATVFLEYLSEYYHYITRDARTDVALGEEVRHAENYAHIQQIRFGRRLHVELGELPREMCEQRVPRLILQPILENAFGHGLKDVAEGGLLTVSYMMDARSLLIRVENNGCTLSDDELEALRGRLSDQQDVSEITGLMNIHRRLRLRYGTEAGLALEQGAQGGLAVTLRLPRKDASHVSNPDR